MPGRTRVLDLSLPTCVSLLACALLATAACQSETAPPFFDPSSHRRDGSQFLPGEGDGGGRPDGGEGPMPAPINFDQTGDPDKFDPAQVYVHGRFEGGEAVVTAYSGLCQDGGASGFADWSSPKNDWMNPNKSGVTVALPCEGDDPRVRVDGSVTYEIAQRAVRAFIQDEPPIEGKRIVVPSHPESGGTGDPEIVVCGVTNGFRHWLSPEDGMIVAVCYSDDGMMRSYVLGDARVEALEIPDEFLPAHLGYENHVLVQQEGMRKRVGVWSPDGGLAELEDLLPFAFEKVGAIRAQEDGFTLLVVDRDDDPPALSQWRISHEGHLTEGAKYPTLEGMSLDASNCDQLFSGGTPLTGTLDPGLSIDRHRSAGCVCALDAEGAALCIARDSKLSQVILRFVPDAQEAEIVYRVEDDPFLIDFKGLVTGP